MKRIFTLCAVSSLMLTGLGSCIGDDKNETTISFDCVTYNLFTPLDGSEEVNVQQAVYSLALALHNSSVETSSPSMATPGGGKVNLAFNTMTYDLYQGMLDNHGAVVYKYGSANAGADGSNVKDLNAYFTQACFLPPEVSGLDIKVNVPNVVGSYDMGYSGYPIYYVAQYKLNDKWLVRTFWFDLTFCGTSYISDESAQFENKEMLYRVVMDVDDTNVIGNKADVLVYNAKFTQNDEQKPEPVIVLKGLNLTFSSRGWQVSGTNVTASTVKEGNLVANEEYRFDFFEASAAGDLVTMNVSSKLKNGPNVNFSGDYMLKPSTTVAQ